MIIRYIKFIFIALSAVGFMIIISATPSHPNMYLNVDEIIVMKDNVDLNRQPWKSAYDELMSEANNALDMPLQSVTFGGTVPPSGDIHDYYVESPYTKDGILNQSADRYDYMSAIKIGKAVRTLGLAYALTGDGKYADKAIQLINAWCVDPDTRMNPRFWYTGQRGQVYIENYITMPGMFYGADLIWNYQGWKTEDKNAFKSWVRSMLDEVKDPFNNCSPNCQNFENWRLVFVSSAASLLDDNVVLNNTFDRWKELIALQMRNDGAMIYELERANSLDYSTYAVNAMIQTAEIAKHHGVDLYNYRLSDGRGLETALDFHAQYVINQSKWPYKQMKKYDGANAALYELAYAFKQKAAYLGVINTWKRPMYENRIMGPVTLTHARKVYDPSSNKS